MSTEDIIDSCSDIQFELDSNGSVEYDAIVELLNLVSELALELSLTKDRIEALEQ